MVINFNVPGFIFAPKRGSFLLARIIRTTGVNSAVRMGLKFDAN
jgi:hypothetical protein